MLPCHVQPALWGPFVLQESHCSEESRECVLNTNCAEHRELHKPSTPPFEIKPAAGTHSRRLLIVFTNSKHYMSDSKNNGEGGETASTSCFHFLFIDINTTQQGKVSF